MTVKRKPYIVIFNMDQCRADALSHLGKTEGITPTMDRIVGEEGVSFRNCFCQNPVCTPSRCSFMSGLYPHVRGHRTMHHMQQLDEPVLLKILKESGYFVWWGGKNDLTPAQDSLEPYCHIKYQAKVTPNTSEWRCKEGTPDYYSFYAGKVDSTYDAFSESDWGNVNGALDFIRTYDEIQPFCIYLALSYPHPPYGVEDPYYSNINLDTFKERIRTLVESDEKPSILKGILKNQKLHDYTEEQWKELRRTYLGMVNRLDHQLGILVDSLKEKGIYEDTALFIFSDHGDFTGDYGLVEKTQNTFEDVLTNVPFIIKPPTGIQVQPGVRECLVELLDFPATVSELTGIELDYTHFGKSLVDIIEGKKEKHKDAVFCEGGRMQGEKHCMELNSKNDIIPTGLYWPRLSWQIMEGPEHTKAIMCRTQDYKYVKRYYEQDELYDLVNDPDELVNQVNNENLKGILLELKERLLDHYMETCDTVPYKMDKRF